MLIYVSLILKVWFQIWFKEHKLPIIEAHAVIGMTLSILDKIRSITKQTGGPSSKGVVWTSISPINSEWSTNYQFAQKVLNILLVKCKHNMCNENMKKEHENFTLQTIYHTCWISCRTCKLQFEKRCTKHLEVAIGWNDEGGGFKKQERWRKKAIHHQIARCSHMHYSW